jgi:hypothetical protein
MSSIIFSRCLLIYRRVRDILNFVIKIIARTKEKDAVLPLCVDNTSLTRDGSFQQDLFIWEN